MPNGEGASSRNETGVGEQEIDTKLVAHPRTQAGKVDNVQGANRNAFPHDHAMVEVVVADLLHIQGDWKEAILAFRSG